MNGPVGPMGMNGENATLRFTNINLTSSCIAVREVENLTSMMRTQNIPILRPLVEVSIQKTIKCYY